MKTHSWLLVFLGALVLVLVACVAAEIQMPAAPSVNLPPDSELNAGEINLTGSGVPGSEVEVLVDGRVAETTQVGADGSWSITMFLAEPGEHQVTVQTRYRTQVPYVGEGDLIAEADPVTVNVARGVALEMTPPSLEQPGGGAELEAGAIVVLSGRGTPGTDAQVVIDGEMVGVAQVGADGTWSLATTVAEAGEHLIAVQTLDASGQVIAEAEPVPVALALPVAVAKVPPSLKSPASGAELEAGDIELTGSGEPGSEVQVLVEGEVMGTAPVGADSAWSLVISLAEAGEYEITAQAVDDSGQVTVEAEPISLVVAPPEVEAEAIAAPTLELPGADAMVEAGLTALTGSGEPDSEVRVLIDGEAAGVAQVGNDGAWSLAITLAQAGEHEIRVQTLDASGNAVAEAEPVFIAVASPMVEAEAEAIAPPTLELPADGAELDAGAVELAGSAAPGSGVQIVADGQIVGLARAGDDGAWSLEVTLAEAGEREISVQTIDVTGDVVAETEPVMFTLNGAAEPSMPESEEQAGLAAAPVTSAVLGTDLVFPADGADIITGEVIAGRLTLIGSGVPGSEVEIFDGSVALGTALVDAQGEWLYTFEPPKGSHQFSVRPVAETAASNEAVNARVATPAEGIDCNSNPGIDRVTTYIVGTCDTLSGISRKTGASLDAVITANPQIEDPDLIFPGDFVSIPD